MRIAASSGQEVLRFTLGHLRGEFVFQPKDAAYLNLLEPWWKVLGWLVLKGRRLESGEPVGEAVDERGCTGTVPALRFGGDTGI
jgi:hypothetical protein